MDTSSPTPSTRIVPGALPPQEKTKKKRHSKSTKEPLSSDATSRQSAPVPETVANPTLSTQPSAHKSSKSASYPVLDILNKRTRNFGKKIQRIKEYLEKSPETLNDDQKKAISSLPLLEAVVQELEDLKKAVEPIEVSTHQTHLSSLEAANTDADARVQDAISSVKITVMERVGPVFGLIGVDISSLQVEESESRALSSLLTTLTSQAETSDKENASKIFIQDHGEWDSVSYERLLHIALSPPYAVARDDAPTPIQANGVAEAEEQAASEASAPVSTNENDLANDLEPVPASASHESGLGGSFHFMQASELDEKPANTEVSIASETVNGFDAESIPVQEHVHHSESDLLPAPTTQDSLDWAADDANELPPINSLHAKFGTSPAGSGDATPIEREKVEESLVSGDVTATKDEQPSQDDGFTAVGKRGGGAFGGGDRGSFRGDRGRGRGFRGGRGSWRGDGGGDFRGRGRGFRGGDRGFRGAPRGRPVESAP